jgi:hypothetical protein
VRDLGHELETIEDALRQGVYRGGPWSRFVTEASQRPRAERRAIVEDVNRVSELLHRRHRRPEVGLIVGSLVAIAAVAAGVVLIELGRNGDGSQLVAGAVLLVIAVQPLIKTCSGLLAGIRFSGVYLRGVEPRVKLRFGTYLAAPVGSRIVFHVAGTVGSPAAAAWASWRAAGIDTAGVAIALAFWMLVAIQLVTLTLGLIGRGQRLTRASSGGMAGREIRGMLRRRQASRSEHS